VLQTLGLESIRQKNGINVGPSATFRSSWEPPALKAAGLFEPYALRRMRAYSGDRNAHG